MLKASSSMSSTAEHLRLLTLFSVLSRICIIGLVWLTSKFPQFDSSAQTLLDETAYPFTSTLLRWDAFHFAQIAQEGYVYEYQWAFFPGTPAIMNVLARLVKFVTGSTIPVGWVDVLRAGGIAALLCDSTHTLYHLSLHHLGSPSLAFLAALLSLLPSSPATLRFAGYTEPFFTYLSYKAGFILWGLIVKPFLQGRKPRPLHVVYAIVLTALIFAPFIIYQYAAYRTFCMPDTPDTPTRPWCSDAIPSIYTFVQSHYWNVGFLRYWTLSQLPNILLASPVLALLFAFSLVHLYHAVPRLLRFSAVKRKPYPFYNESITPHAMHALVMSCAYLFASHTQIVLRQAAAMPLVYWAAAWLVVEKPRWGKVWVVWSVVWGAISVVLWTAFLPPA
ncbi:hypothetical protein EWM64_g4582 [Hericium alpestre]|uniref:GPI mannosyltransferase 2 n=1 Tax=Hericium alpestre TaxID=135208 RepID=A0A4Y9ZX95_9AGAM|nr:hypothetical protein EWM64_g4582 [Hericium alpestre]